MLSRNIPSPLLFTSLLAMKPATNPKMIHAKMDMCCSSPAKYTGELYNLTTRSFTLVLTWGMLLLAAGGESRRTAVQDLTSHEFLSSFTLHSVAGTRDGDRLHAQAIFSDSSSILDRKSVV